MAEWLPAPPDGYRLDDPEYGQPWYVTVFLYIWLVGAYIGIPALVIGVHGLDVATGIVGEIVWQESWNGLVIYTGWVLGFVAITIAVHESVHALVGHWVGLRTKFTFEYSNPLNWSAQALTYGGFQSSRESIIISLAPIVTLTPVSIVVLVVSQQSE